MFVFSSTLCRHSLVVAVFAVLLTSFIAPQPAAAAPQSPPTAPLDANTVYRLDLFTEALRPVPVAELKPGAIYYRYSNQSGQHVWSRANNEGGFEFALGPGSVQPAWRFDIREGRETQLRVLEQRSPNLYRRLITEGARPMIKLSESGHWEIDLASNEGRVFDMETGQRWEWHGGHRVAVVHTGGRIWAYRDGDYVPAPIISSIIW
jgi:hypothetical protein